MKGGKKMKKAGKTGKTGKPKKRGKPEWTAHRDGYLHSGETSFLAFHNAYPEGKQGGIEIIHHDERIASNGMLRVFF